MCTLSNMYVMRVIISKEHKTYQRVSGRIIPDLHAAHHIGINLEIFILFQLYFGLILFYFPS